WFHQAYLAKMLEKESHVRVEGRVTERNGQFSFSNPKIEPAPTLFKQGSHSLYPIYPETRGITSNWLYHKIQQVFASGILEKIYDPIPHELLEKYNLPSLKTALVWAHTPKNRNDANIARKRFAFQEIFFIQIEK